MNLDFTPTLNVVGAGCGFGLEGEPGTESNGKIGYMSDCLEEQGVGFIYGPITQDVGNVLVMFDPPDEVPIRVPIYRPTAPAGADASSVPYDFYLTPVEGCPAVAAVLAQDPNGQPLAQINLEPRSSE